MVGGDKNRDAKTLMKEKKKKKILMTSGSIGISWNQPLVRV